ncbi:hypothetical protein GCM10009837_50790 [Streptomyces durmitorensis]
MNRPIARARARWRLVECGTAKIFSAWAAAALAASMGRAGSFVGRYERHDNRPKRYVKDHRHRRNDTVEVRRSAVPRARGCLLPGRSNRGRALPVLFGE